MNVSRLVPVGKIIRTHGLRGAVKIVPYGETVAQLGPGDRLCLSSPLGSGQAELIVLQSRRQGKCCILQFAELRDIDAAETVVGQEVFVPEEFLQATSEGEYYHYQLIGLHVETSGGETIGTLRGIIETGGNDVYVVDLGNREILIPAIAEVILEVDLQGGKMIIEPPEGLLDDL
ncbi:MAG TPA: ribosome maturation factor RimM [Syntrophobacteraceae bacterium]|nr:ribosome maturation factor RimM [Syntrophobacteraceae bacterium]